MSATITSQTRVHSAINFINGLDDEPVYFFAGKIDAWDDEGVPDIAVASYKDTREAKKANVFIKKTDSSNCMLGLLRFDWTSGTVYTEWSDTLDMPRTTSWLSASQPFYVYVQDSSSGSYEYNVYLCLDNANGAPSVNEPSGQSTTTQTLADGYIWKFIYNISSDFGTFIGSTIIPCPHRDADKTVEHLAVETNTISGTINRIEIENGGTTYVDGSADIVIGGDGTGATAVPTITAGVVTGVTITNVGSGYTYADVAISGGNRDCVLAAIISPINGHGYDASMQLGASHILHKGIFITTESGLFPIVTSYRRIGLLHYLKDPDGIVVSGTAYDVTDQITITGISGGSFTIGSRLVGNTSESTAVLFNQIGDICYVTDKRGEFEVGESIYLGGSPSILGTCAAINNNEDVDIYSGDIIYQENTIAVSRRTGQSETFIFSIEF